MIILSPWTKLIILFCGALFVAIAIVVVVCVVSPFCFCHRFLPESAKLPYEPVGKKKKKKSNGSFYTCEPVELTKLNTIAQYDYGSPLSSFVNSDNGPKSPPPSTIHGHRRLYTIDSSYSSMSPTTEAGSRPHSPTSTVVDDDAQSICSPPSLSSEIVPILYGNLTVSFQYETKEDSNLGRMIINLIEARALPGREYHASSCDPFVKIVLLKLRTRLRRSRSHYMTLSEFQSQTIRHSKCPYFGQTFAVELTKSDMKDCALKFIVYDRDKYANPTELGEAVIPLNDIHLNETSEASEPLSFELQESKQNNGELLLGLSYLPTSERLSIHVIRAVNLKYETIATNIDVLNLEVRILLLHNGKAIKKKKTPPVASTNNPTFDHTLAFDVPTSQLDHVIFLVGVAHKAEVVSESDDGLTEKSSRHDCFIGKVILGSCVTSSAVHHWQAMLHCPRQQVTSWHVLR